MRQPKDYQSAEEMLDEYQRIRERLRGGNRTPITVDSIENKSSTNNEQQEVLEHHSITFDHILSVCSSVYGVSSDDILGPRRFREVSSARWMASYLAVKHLYPSISISGIARRLNKDHTSVLYARDKMKVKTLIDQNLAHKVHEIECYLGLGIKSELSDRNPVTLATIG